MRIAVVNTQVPFVTGGAERHAANLRAALERHGHEAVEVNIPFKWYPGRTLIDSIMAAKLVDLSESTGVPIDMMVGLKFPAYLAHHPNRVFWILHQHRQAYDQWDSGHSDLLHLEEGPALRDLIREEDRAAFSATAHPIWCNSRNVAGRLRRYLGMEGQPLYHPPPNAGKMRSGPYGDYIFAPSRLNPGKRQGLMLEALARTAGPVRLVLAGTADTPAHRDALAAKARELGVEDRVEWWGAIDDATMIRGYAGARAVCFVPIDEDYGYITLEAMLAARPVITATDAGGPLEFVRDGAEGIVAEPEPGALAAAFDRVMEDRAGAERMGQVGLARYRAEGISWRSVVERLTGAAASGGADAESGSDGEADAMAETAGKGAAAPPASGARSAPPAGAEGDLGALRARLAPRLPEAPPFESVDALLAAYALGTHDGTDAATDARIAAYLGTHWTRYLATLALALETAPRRVLDVGVAPPFAFQALLAAALPGVEMAGVWNRDRPWAQRVESRDGRHPGFDMTLRPANAERDPLPAADAAHDLVLAMEIFEHFAVDPLHFLHEAARVLEPGGHLLLTTPNIVSHRGVWKALNGAAPYSFGLFVPAEGAQGRHNREYTPREVAALAEAAGFETVRLTTADVYDDRIEAEAARLLAARGDDFALRGETILYLGRKAGTPGPVPPGLYHGDPGQLAARLALLDHDRAAGVARIRAENTAREPWPAEGEWAASLLLEWADAEGTLRHGEGRVPLSDPVAPGEAAEITLSLGPAPAGAAEGMLTVEMFQEGAGRFAAAGRANVLSLPCAESAFLRLAGAGAP